MHKLIVTLLAAAAFSVGAQSPGGPVKGDDVLLEMGAAFKAADTAKLSRLLPQAKGHPLEVWAAYWELKARLPTATEREVQDFMARYAGTYLEDRMRNDWLLLLGQRRQWSAFAAEAPNFRMNDDREVRCYNLLIEHLRKGPAATPQLADEVQRLWLLQRDGDDGCLHAASELLDAKKLAPIDVWRKARLSMEQGRTRAARNAVEIVAPEVVPQVTEIASNPVKFLAGRATAPGQVRKELVLLALIKVATSDAEVAATLLDGKWGPLLNAEERNWAWGVIGKQAANRLSPTALTHYGNVGKLSDLTDDMLAWYARAALRAGSTPKWPQVLAAINAMDNDTRNEATWVYWKARALQALTPPSKRAAYQAVLAAPAPVAEPAASGASSEVVAPPAKPEYTVLFERIAGVRGFYEMLALEELGRKVSVPVKPAPPTADERAAALKNPGLQRALYAIGIGLRSEGVREWNYHTNFVNAKNQLGAMSERELLAAAQLACDRQVWDRCINTSERTKNEFDADQRFPMPYRDAVVKRAREINLDPAYVYGLIRQESRFITDARSVVGASGLMQVMPATARWTAKKIGLTGFTPDQITERDTNIAIGTGYLKLVLDDFAGSMPLAAAAYNAGPGRPRNWRGQTGEPVYEAAVWAENVPFFETRDYVKKVLANTTLYAAILSGQPQSIKSRLGTVGPRDISQPEVNRDLP